MGVKCGLTPKEKHRLRVFENRDPRRIFGPKCDEKQESEGNCTFGSFIICAHLQISLVRSNQGE
jgi:hypothetical protein